MFKVNHEGTQVMYTCSKSTIETIENGMKYAQSSLNNIRTTLMTPSGIFKGSTVSIVDFEQVNVS